MQIKTFAEKYRFHGKFTHQIQFRYTMRDFIQRLKFDVQTGGHGFRQNFRLYKKAVLGYNP